MTLLQQLTERTYKLTAAEWKEQYNQYEVNNGRPLARTIINGVSIAWYEHPTNGDEDGFIVITPQGTVHPTNEFEILDWRDE